MLKREGWKRRKEENHLTLRAGCDMRSIYEGVQLIWKEKQRIKQDQRIGIITLFLENQIL